MTNKSIWIQRSLIDSGIDPEDDELVEWAGQVQEIIQQNPDGQVEIIVLAENEAETKLEEKSGTEYSLDLCSSCGLLVASLTEHSNECSCCPTKGLELDSTCSLVDPSSPEHGCEQLREESVEEQITIKPVQSPTIWSRNPPNEPLSCDICSKEFNSRNYTKMHSASCNKDVIRETMDKQINYTMEMKKRYQCPRCFRLFSSYQILLEHLDSTSFDCKKITCNACGLVFKRHDSWESHRKKCVGIKFSKNPQCPKCNKAFTTMQHLEVHLQKNTCYRHPTCRCGFSSKNIRSLSTHQRYCPIQTLRIEELDRFTTTHESQLKLQTSKTSVNTQLTNMTCPKCNKHFATRKIMLVHIKRKICQQSFACEKCGKTFKSKGPLGMHRRHCIGIGKSQKMSCLKCGLYFRSKQALNQHINCCKGSTRISEIQNNNGCLVMLSCGKCGKTYRRLGELEKHINSCNGIEKPKCKECGRSFSNKEALSVHVSKKRCRGKMACEKCGKVLKASIALTNHMKVCDGTSPLETTKCQKCDRIFSSKGALYQHISKNSSSLTCNMCCRKFKSSQKLTTHQYICKGKFADTIIQCPHCSKILSCEVSLHQHLQSQTCYKKFICKICGRCFKNEKCWIKHQNSCTVKTDQPS